MHREPDHQEVIDDGGYAAMHREVEKLVRIEMGKYSSPRVSYQTNGTPKWKDAFLVVTAFMQLVLLGLGGWALSKLSTQGQDIAVIKCQLSEECHHAITRGGYPQYGSFRD